MSPTGKASVSGKRKIIRYLEGAVLSIDLGDGTYCFARLLKRPTMAFYDLRASHIPPLEEILSRPVLFKLWVMAYAVTKGVWPVVGRHPLEPSLQEVPVFFKQDGPGKFCTYREGEERRATRAEIEGLECAAVWDPEHVVDRLKDHYAGRKNKWVESLRPKD